MVFATVMSSLPNLLHNSANSFFGDPLPVRADFLAGFGATSSVRDFFLRFRVVVVESTSITETYPIGCPSTGEKAFLFFVVGWDGDGGSSLTFTSGLWWRPAKVIKFVSQKYYPDLLTIRAAFLLFPAQITRMSEWSSTVLFFFLCTGGTELVNDISNIPITTQIGLTLG